jgi:hypothetical protein
MSLPPHEAHPAYVIDELTSIKRLTAVAQPNHRMVMLLLIYSPEGRHNPVNRRQKTIALLVFLRLIGSTIKPKKCILPIRQNRQKIPADRPVIRDDNFCKAATIGRACATLKTAMCTKQGHHCRLLAANSFWRAIEKAPGVFTGG